MKSNESFLKFPHVMSISYYFRILLVAGLGLSAPLRSMADAAYVVEEQGRGTWRAAFDKKMDTSVFTSDFRCSVLLASLRHI